MLLDVKETVQIHDVVALLHDMPEQGLVAGQVGTVVIDLAPGVFEVEFSDNSGRAYAMAALNVEALLILHNEPVVA